MKFESTNQDSAGEKKNVLSWRQMYVTNKGIEVVKFFSL